MDIARYSIDKPVNTWLIILACLLGGWWGLSGIGRLEDPAFTIKMALVITPYPGATAAQVEEEITEPLESAIQQLPQLKRLTSRSRPGESIIKVEIQNKYDGETMPQVWDELRRKVGDAQSTLRLAQYARWCTTITVMYSVFSTRSRRRISVMPRFVNCHASCVVNC